MRPNLLKNACYCEESQGRKSEALQFVPESQVRVIKT